MSAVLAQPGSVRPPRAEERSVRALAERRPAWKAGLAGTAVAHAVLFIVLWLMPLDVPQADSTVFATAADRSFEIELTPELFRPVAPASIQPPRFVEVNPAAPDNEPDKTPLVGAQNQQVAQPVPTPEGRSDTPKVDGEGDKNATAIVSGLATEPATPSAAEILSRAFESPDEAREAADRLAKQPAARAVNAPAGGEQLLGESDGGTGTTVTRLPAVPGAETGPEAREGSATGRAATGGYFSGTPRIDRNRPQERPRLSAATVNARQTPTIKNEFGSKNIGAVAYNAKWSAYGEYLQRLIDAVQAQWERLILRSSFYPTAGATVRVVFRIDAKGEIFEVVGVDGSGGELARRLCVSAITERAPYGEWTEDMVAVLGREQELTFTFFYQ